MRMVPTWALAVVASSLLLVSCGRTEAKAPPRQPPVILVFADVTDSLQDGGAEAVHKAIGDIFDRAPEEATIRVYPIVAGMQIAEAYGTTFPFQTSTGFQALKQAHDERASAAKEAIRRVEAFRRAVDPNVQSSCISGAIRRAASDMAAYAGRPVDVVIISDMVEDCGRSIGNGRVALTRPGISKEIASAQALTTRFADLHQADVYFLHPANLKAAVSPNARSATQQELESFWSALATRCNARSVRFMAGPELYQTGWTSARGELERLRQGNG